MKGEDNGSVSSQAQHSLQLELAKVDLFSEFSDHKGTKNPPKTTNFALQALLQLHLPSVFILTHETFLRKRLLFIIEKMNTKYDDNIAYFISFCIETYKNAHGINGADASQIFSETGLTEFLAKNFEPIHTQSPQWILEEINDYLSAHKN